jgi:hypothetical protein
MEKIKYYKAFINENKNISFIENLLNKLENFINELIGKIEKEHIKIFDRKLSDSDKELERLKLIYDLVKSLEIWTETTDKLLSYTTTVSKKGNLVISLNVERNGAEYYLHTEVIYAGGYNIQRLHYRYLTKTNLPRTNNKSYSDIFSKKIKDKEKIRKLEQENINLNKRIENNTQRIEINLKLSDDEIIDILTQKNGNVYNTTWNEIVSRDADKNYKSEEDFNIKKSEFRKYSIDFWKNINIKSLITQNKSLEKLIEQNKLKINKLKNN